LVVVLRLKMFVKSSMYLARSGKCEYCCEVG
jgi:hypothetical protein